MRKYIINILALMLFLTTNIEVQAQSRQISMKDYGILPNQSVSIAPKLAEALAKIKQTQGKHEKLNLLFEKGTYLFDAKDSPKKVVYISNHDQVGRRSIGILLE